MTLTFCFVNVMNYSIVNKSNCRKLINYIETENIKSFKVMSRYVNCEENK